ncbi:MAG: N-acetylmannosamine kinase, partial [Ruminococcus sp.]|nr:N-acetylmannosamine kinase [Ruminococcus sp.]
VVSTVETLEEIWGEYQVYSSDELNHVSDTVNVEGEKSHE